MRRTIPLLALALASCGNPAADKVERAPVGGGIVSLSPCVDQLLVALAPSRRIAAISRLSHDPAASAIPQDVALRFRAVGDTAEEVLALKPTLVLATSFTPPATREAFARAGLNVVYLGAPVSIDDSKAQVAQVAAALNENEAGRALIGRIDHAVQTAGRRGGGVPALIYIGGTMANGGGTLLDSMMTRAGFRDAASDYGLQHTGTIPLETLVAHPPRVVFAPPEDRGRAARAGALAHSGARVIQADFAHPLVNCGGPSIIPAMARLGEVREQLDK